MSSRDELKDAIAKAIADVVGHGMREKCERHAEAALAVIESDPITEFYTDRNRGGWAHWRHKTAAEAGYTGGPVSDGGMDPREREFAETALAATGRGVASDAEVAAEKQQRVMVGISNEPGEIGCAISMHSNPDGSVTVDSMTKASSREDDRILWGIVANAGRLSDRRKVRWGHVSDATAMGSQSSIALCRRFGFDPDEEVGGRENDHG